MSLTKDRAKGAANWETLLDEKYIQVVPSVISTIEHYKTNENCILVKLNEKMHYRTIRLQLDNFLQPTKIINITKKSRFCVVNISSTEFSR